MIELQLGLVLAIVNDKLTLHLDLTQLVAPDDSRTLGQLIRALGTLNAAPREAEATLASALPIRNRLVHHFFIRNIDAFQHENVFREVLAALESDSRLLSACLILIHGIYERLCTELRIDSDKIVVRQYRVHQDGAR